MPAIKNKVTKKAVEPKGVPATTAAPAKKTAPAAKATTPASKATEPVKRSVTASGEKLTWRDRLKFLAVCTLAAFGIEATAKTLDVVNQPADPKMKPFSSTEIELLPGEKPEDIKAAIEKYIAAQLKKLGESKTKGFFKYELVIKKSALLTNHVTVRINYLDEIPVGEKKESAAEKAGREMAEVGKPSAKPAQKSTPAANAPAKQARSKVVPKPAPTASTKPGAKKN